MIDGGEHCDSKGSKGIMGEAMKVIKKVIVKEIVKVVVVVEEWTTVDKIEMNERGKEMKKIFKQSQLDLCGTFHAQDTQCASQKPQHKTGFQRLYK